MLEAGGPVCEARGRGAAAHGFQQCWRRGVQDVPGLYGRGLRLHHGFERKKGGGGGGGQKLKKEKKEDIFFKTLADRNLALFLEERGGVNRSGGRKKDRYMKAN